MIVILGSSIGHCKKKKKNSQDGRFQVSWANCGVWDSLELGFFWEYRAMEWGILDRECRVQNQNMGKQASWRIED